MADVFVSYSREDKERAAEVVRLLEAHGWDVFWDQELRAGTLWPKVLETELDSARCLVALWTLTSIDSNWVRIEAYEALQHHKLLPVLLDDVQPPLEFRQTQTLDLIGWDGAHDDARVRQLLDDLRVLAASPHEKDAKRTTRIAVPTIRRERAHSAPPTEPRPAPELADPRSTSTSVEAVDQATVNRPAPHPPPSRAWMFGVGAAVLVISATWAVPRLILKEGASTGDNNLKVPSTSVPAERVPVTVPPPPIATVKPTPDPTVKSVPDTTVVVKPPVSTGQSKPSAKSPAARCLVIMEKVQQGGQLSSSEQEFLRSRECQ